MYIYICNRIFNDRNTEVVLFATKWIQVEIISTSDSIKPVLQFVNLRHYKIQYNICTNDLKVEAKLSAEQRELIRRVRGENGEWKKYGQNILYVWVTRPLSNFT